MEENATLRDIMHYEPDIWAIADDLLAAAIKQSDFPMYMMPFFALMMLEGRMRNAIARIKEEEGLTPENDPEDFKEAFLERGCGFNKFIVMEGKTLKKIVSNDTSFEQDFGNYLKEFDGDLKRLLGVDRAGEEKFLNMDTVVANLRSKGILLQIAKKWAMIDLAPYSNSDITTLEEHIKRRWADISASTAGEQYTPDDIIALISEIVSAKLSKPKTEFVHLYDPTCGGANLLYGVADRLAGAGGYTNVATYGSEYNDALYALAAIESRFRSHSTIKYGNTLTKIPFQSTQFDVIVANPPYGTKWSGYEKDIKADETGQFAGGIPAISDGQLLFMQHILWQLADTGIAVEVHNGSSIFSGDAGSGESNIRKYVFDHDWVEAIIQMPQQEFFNTGIYTYLWIMNKRKPEPRRNRVALIDGSKGWCQLKKSKGDKRREMLSEHRQAIVDALLTFEPSDICKIYDREYFYYNKQQITLTEVSDEGRYVEQTVCPEGENFLIVNPVKIIIGEDVWNIDRNTWEKDKNIWDDTSTSDIEWLTGMTAQVKRGRQDGTTIETADGKIYKWIPDQQTHTVTDKNGKVTDLGNGQFLFQTKFSRKKGVPFMTLKVSLTPLYSGDYEIVAHRFDTAENDEEIAHFMERYITKPFTLGKNTVGVELNFNKEFYVPEPIESADTILAEIRSLEQQVQEIEL